MNQESYLNYNNNIIEMPDIDYHPVDSIGVEYFRFFKSNHDRVAQYVVATNEEDTYGELLKRCIRTALKIKSKNLNPSNDIICICSYNHKNSCVPWIASTFLGIKVASLDPKLSIDDTAHLLKQVKPALIFLVPEAINLIEESLRVADLKTTLVVFGESDNCEDFQDYLEHHDDDDDEDNFEPVKTNIEDTAVIFFSSGTTGLPKGICQNSYAILCQAYNFVKTDAITSVTLSNASLYWISSILLMTAVFMTGTSRVITRQFNATEIWLLIDKYKVSTIFLAPIEALEMLKAGRPDNLDTSSLLILYTGGGIMPTQQLLQLRDLLPGTFVAQVYGQTEVAGAITIFDLNKVRDILLLDSRPESCGRPIPGIHYKIVDLDDENTILGANQHGELCLKTKFCMNGYHNLDSSSCFDNDMWLRTGDIAYYDQDYCFYIVDRIKELLKYRSWHVQPTLIENILIEHPAIRKAVVIGIPHDEDGDHPMAIVMLNTNVDKPTVEEIQDYVAERVDDRQRLRGGVRFVQSFPITPSAKIKKQLLKKMVLQGEI